jgi:hypothetical protein
MLILTFLAAGVGIALGLRYKVLVLLPAFIIAAPPIVVTSIIQGRGIVSAIAAMVCVVIGLQFGYLLGGIMGRALILHLTARRVAWPIRHITGTQQ